MVVQQGGDDGRAEAASKEMERELGPSLWSDKIREVSPHCLHLFTLSHDLLITVAELRHLLLSQDCWGRLQEVIDSWPLSCSQ